MRVLEILGFEFAETNEPGVFSVKKFSQKILNSDKELFAVLAELDTALKKSGKTYNSQYSGYLSSVRKFNPQTRTFDPISFTTSSEEKSGEQKPSTLLIKLTEEDIKAYS